MAKYARRPPQRVRRYDLIAGTGNLTCTGGCNKPIRDGEEFALLVRWTDELVRGGSGQTISNAFGEYESKAKVVCRPDPQVILEVDDPEWSVKEPPVVTMHHLKKGCGIDDGFRRLPGSFGMGKRQ